MSIIEINTLNQHLLELFIKQIDSDNFRYYKNRDLSCLKNHLHTILLIQDNISIGYGHIDYNDLDKKYFLGICVLLDYQNNGYGNIIMKNLINKFNQTYGVNELFLTVDINNIKAIKLYKKFNFNIYCETNDNYLMKLNKSFIILPTSYGEALDKFSILEIKLDKINDDRKKDIINEYNELKIVLNSQIEKCLFYYNILKKVNLLIWNKQVEFRCSIDNEINKKLCFEIIEENDKRFRIKNKINNILNSHLKEQKGYKLRILNIVLNCSEDIINILIGAIRYYSFYFDILNLYCNEKIINNIRHLFIDDILINVNDIINYTSTEDDYIIVNENEIDMNISHPYFINKEKISNKENDSNINYIYNNLNLCIDIYKEYRY